jgi:short-subunit dehydrogenase
MRFRLAGAEDEAGAAYRSAPRGKAPLHDRRASGRIPGDDDRGIIMRFSEQYGPWALVAGASEGVGAEFAERLAQRGLDVVLLARRQAVLDEVAAAIRSRHGVAARTLVVDLAEPDAAARVLAGVADLEIGFFAYCAGADPDYQPFLSASLGAAESMVHRNCKVPMQLCHHLARPMVERARGGIVIFGSGAGFAGAPNMVAYAATKAFDMVFAEALWSELKPKGIDVLGLILGETDTPALRRLRHDRGLAGPDEPVQGAASAQEVVDDAFAYLAKGPTRLANKQMRRAFRLLFPLPRRVLVRLLSKAGQRTMGKDAPT